MGLFLAIWCRSGLALAGLALTAGTPDLPSLLKSVESRYNRAKTLEVQFTETYSGQGRPRQSESGRLVLRKPGRMRWDYSEPPGKLFLSDGKLLYLYTPGLNRVERMPLKESDDMRAPLAFLLGKLDFGREFKSFEFTQEGDLAHVAATAKSNKLPYDKVEMWIGPAFEIRKLVVTGLDQSTLSFQFAQETINPPVDDGQFRFTMPPGATMVNGQQGQ